MTVTELDQRIRMFLFSSIAGRSATPPVVDTATHFGISVQDVNDSYQRLHDAHMIVLKPGSHEVRMAMPFSTVPTAYRVDGEKNSWWANCAWDALGISVALNQKVKIVSQCPDCHEPISLEAPPKNDYTHFAEVIHFALPVKKWWDDVFFT